MRRLFDVVLFIALVVLAYIYRGPLFSLGQQLFTRAAPCVRPILYSIGEFDTRFGISRENFLSSIEAAENIWEKPIGKNLFEYRESGTLRIALIYDERQVTTEKLKGLDATLDESRASYNALKEKYDGSKADYARKKSEFESAVTDFDERQAAYAKEVQGWNARGGAPRAEYERLEREKAALTREASQVQELQSVLNGQADTVNALVEDLNRLASLLNLDVARYNTVGKAVGAEFEEGSYEETPGMQKIEIYEFGSRAELVRVLAHELGHALGLPHVDDEGAIMFRLNQSTNEKATTADIEELKQHCGIQ